MKTVLLLFILVVSIFSSCNSLKNNTSPELSNQEMTTVKKTGDINVPDGFTFKTDRTVQLDLTTFNKTGKIQPKTLIKIFGIPEKGKPDQLFSGITNKEGKFKNKIIVPNHFLQLQVKIQFKEYSEDFILPIKEQVTMDLKLRKTERKNGV